ncbi:MAG: hypothetical protein EAY75_17635 [Bacteroidetes bacterium]|nr:MAG: hypothetical protein EAY75_17635 [Bacteroidota bacterium]
MGSKTAVNTFCDKINKTSFTGIGCLKSTSSVYRLAAWLLPTVGAVKQQSFKLIDWSNYISLKFERTTYRKRFAK